MTAASWGGPHPSFLWLIREIPATFQNSPYARRHRQNAASGSRFGKLTSDDEQSKLDETMSDQVSNLRFDFAAYRREAHHYAVDRFYKTYFSRKRGAPPLPTAYLDGILRLRFKGLNYVSIAEKLGQPKGRMKKQLETAEKRWREAVARIEQIKTRFPHLVAAEPIGQVGKQRASGQQSKRQNAKARTGK